MSLRVAFHPEAVDDIREAERFINVRRGKYCRVDGEAVSQAHSTTTFPVQTAPASLVMRYTLRPVAHGTRP